MKNILVGAMSAAVLTVAAGAADAATVVTFDFSGANSYGDFSGSVSLDVTDGLATSGTGVFTGEGLVDAPMVLITTATPGNETAGAPTYPVGFRDDGGTDLTWFDTVVPVDAGGGLLFDVGATTAAWGQHPLFGIWSGGSIFSGQTPTGYDYADWGNEGIANFASASVPEPATWAMLLLGFGGLGAVMRSRRRTATLSA